MAPGLLPLFKFPSQVPKAVTVTVTCQASLRLGGLGSVVPSHDHCGGWATITVVVGHGEEPELKPKPEAERIETDRVATVTNGFGAFSK